MSETSREEIEKLVEEAQTWVEREKADLLASGTCTDRYSLSLVRSLIATLISQQRSLDRVAALCDADSEYLKAVGELPAFIRAVCAALEGREFRENA